jgi:hypothetical protein
MLLQCCVTHLVRDDEETRNELRGLHAEHGRRREIRDLRLHSRVSHHEHVRSVLHHNEQQRDLARSNLHESTRARDEGVL